MVKQQQLLIQEPVKQIEIRDYDLTDGEGIVDTYSPGVYPVCLGSPFSGFNIGEKHYIISEEDFLDSTIGKGGLIIPKTAYELVSYNEKTRLAVAREVTESSLLETIAVEFHMKDFERDL